MSDKTTFTIFVLASILFLLTLLFFIESGLINENFASLQSQALLTLTTTNVVKEQELASNIIQTAKAEIADAQSDVDKATIIEATAMEQLTRANSELTSRKKNLVDIKASLTKMFPPGSIEALDSSAKITPMVQ
jgi:hypothetical protein